MIIKSRPVDVLYIYFRIRSLGLINELYCLVYILMCLYLCNLLLVFIAYIFIFSEYWPTRNIRKTTFCPGL